MHITYNEKLKLVLHRSLANWLHYTNKKNIHEVHKSITSQSTTIGFQDINITTEYAENRGAYNYIKTASCDLCLIFYIMTDAHNMILCNYEQFKANIITLLGDQSYLTACFKLFNTWIICSFMHVFCFFKNSLLIIHFVLFSFEKYSDV